MTISYVFPNTSENRLRGRLDDRSRRAKEAGCSFIEVPADLIKNKTEVSVTGQEFCSFLTRESIGKLYLPAENPAGILPYILHTDPALNKMVRLRWNDTVWTEKFVRMILDIAEYLGTPPAKVEIHPGDRENSFTDIISGVKAIQTGFQDSYGKSPEILLENRTDQFISRGPAIAKLWDYVMQNDPGLAENFGIVLDVQQLLTMTGEDFLPSFNQIPTVCLKGFHIHRLHRPPAVGDGIPWSEVFARIAGIERDIIINPEIHHNNQVAGVIGFCEGMITKGNR